MASAISQVSLTPLRIIPANGGAVRHGLKSSDLGFQGFGEAYFSQVEHNTVRGWKRHRAMYLNLIVVVGEMRFVVTDGTGAFRSFNLTPDRSDSYARLTVPPGLWMAFGCVSKSRSMLLNIASIEHDPTEADQLPFDAFAWSW